LIFSVEYIV